MREDRARNKIVLTVFLMDKRDMDDEAQGVAGEDLQSYHRRLIQGLPVREPLRQVQLPRRMELCAFMLVPRHHVIDRTFTLLPR